MSEETRILIGFLCLAVAVWLSVWGGRRLWAYVIFEKYPKKTKMVGAILQEAEQKNNVRVGLCRSFFVRHMTKAVYAYTVEGKVYYIKTTHYLTTKRQTPKFVPIVYITTHPGFAYIDKLGVGSEMDYALLGIIPLFWSFLLIFVAFASFGVVG